jgi:hypothetical protein
MAKPSGLWLVVVGVGGVLIGAVGMSLIEHWGAKEVREKVPEAGVAARVTVPRGFEAVAGPSALVKSAAIPDREHGSSVPSHLDAAAKPKAGGYDFQKTSGAGATDRLVAILDSEATDLDWAPRASLMLQEHMHAQYGFANFPNLQLDCKSSMCRVEILLDPGLVMPASESNNPQVLFTQFMADPAFEAMFDGDSIMTSIDSETGLARLDYFVHRRAEGARGDKSSVRS